MVNGQNRKQGMNLSKSVTSLQFLSIILITIVLTVVLDFGHRAASNADLKKEALRLEREVATLEAKHRALEVQREIVQTDDYVEEWARTEGGMVLRGETPVVPIPAGPGLAVDKIEDQPVSDSIDASEETGARSGYWQEWWEFFFGTDEASVTRNVEE